MYDKLLYFINFYYFINFLFFHHFQKPPAVGINSVVWMVSV